MEVVNAQEPEEPREVRLEVIIDWTPERIEKEIRDTFYFDPHTAIAIVKAEGGLNKEIQSHIVTNGIQEPSFCAFQIHEPSWMKKAKKLGYGDYKTNPASCIKMARYIYDNATDRNGNRLYWNSWSAYKNGSYLGK